MQIERGRLLVRGAARVHRALARPGFHGRGPDRLGDAEVHVQVVAQARTVRREGPGRACGDEPILLERSQRLPQRRTRHAELVGELGLRRSFDPGAIRPVAILEASSSRTRNDSRFFIGAPDVRPEGRGLLCQTNSVKPSVSRYRATQIRWSPMSADRRRRPLLAQSFHELGLVGSRRRCSDAAHPATQLACPHQRAYAGRSGRRRVVFAPLVQTVGVVAVARRRPARRDAVRVAPAQDLLRDVASPKRLTDKPSMWLDTR